MKIWVNVFFVTFFVTMVKNIALKTFPNSNNEDLWMGLLSSRVYFWFQSLYCHNKVTNAYQKILLWCIQVTLFWPNPKCCQFSKTRRVKSSKFSKFWEQEPASCWHVRHPSWTILLLKNATFYTWGKGINIWKKFFVGDASVLKLNSRGTSCQV